MILREMLTAIPKHKGTDKMQGDLRRRISKLEQAVDQKQKRGGRDLFHVPREGAGQVLLAGAPNAGKSSLMAGLTHATPQVANYPYTTQLPLPGMVQYEDVQIQLVDAPPLSREYTEAALFNAFRLSDMILFVVDLTTPDPPGDLRESVEMLAEHFIKVAPKAPLHQSGSLSTVEKQPLVFANKVDKAGREGALGLGEVIGSGTRVFIGSAETGEGLGELPRALFEALRLIRVYTKKPGQKFERGVPFVLREGATVMDATPVIHKELADKMRFARLWGSGKHQGLSVPRDHLLADGDILEIHAG
ncbi:MAG: 50S ribosome-binding GTPase [Candidatus Eisenbacteria sp.]|nr:50S ribosome-binding GTPase [Candidatus Eisenbacteria bacterium]